MGNGLELELLMQLFFVLEGLSLWKVATPAARSIADFAAEDEKGGELRQAFLATARTYRLWRRAAAVVCSFAPLTFFAVMVIVLSFFFDVKSGGCLRFLNLVAVLYFTAKATIVLVTLRCARRYDAILKSLTPVPTSPHPDQLQSV